MAKVKLNVNFTLPYSENFPFVCKVLMSAVLLEGEKSKPLNIGQGVAQGCSILPSSLFIFINELLNEVEKAGIGIKEKDVKVGGLKFADDFVALTTKCRGLTDININIVQGFCNKCRHSKGCKLLLLGH